MTKKIGPGGLEHAKSLKEIVWLTAKNYIIGQARPKKGDARSAFLVLEV